MYYSGSETAWGGLLFKIVAIPFVGLLLTMVISQTTISLSQPSDTQPATENVNDQIPDALSGLL
jgi:hypothetical protein